MVDKYEDSKYEVLKIRRSKEYIFLIKKIYWKEFVVEKGRVSISDAGLKIYFSELPNGINVSTQTPWSIKWERDFIEVEASKVKYADSSVLEVDKEYRDIGLGSYLLDSLTQWAQEEFNESTVDIQVVSKDYTDSPESVIEHFYGKRNLNRGVKVSEVKTFLEESQESGKVEVTGAVNYLLKLFKNNFELKKLKDQLIETNRLDQNLTKQLIREIASNKLLMFFSVIVSLSLGWFLGAKFG